MKAILASSSIFNIENGIETVERLVGKTRDKISTAIINEASAMAFGDQRWAIDEITKFAETFGGDIEIVHLLALSSDKIKERLMSADVILVLGGDTDWLQVVFDRSGLSKILPDILREKVYIGSSAGSSIIGIRETVENGAAMYPGEFDNNFGISKYLEYVDFEILPHYGYENDFFNVIPELVIAESSRVSCPVYALSDKSAILLEDDISIIGENWIKALNGQMLNKG